jgi:hypothetical protein
MITISRSAVVTRKTCQMKRYWNYHAQPFGDTLTPGIVPLNASPRSQLPKIRGQIFHDAAAKLWANAPWQDWVTDTCRARLAPEMAEEQATLIRRALLGWTVVRGEMLNDYAVVSAEQEWTWNITPDVRQALRLDRILRRNDDGTLAIFDFKTLRAPDKNWIERLQHSEQTHLYIQALKSRSEEWVAGMIYDGIIIGSLDEDNHQKSPFVRAYRRKDLTLSPKYVAGAPSVSTLDWPDEQWLEWSQHTGILPELYCTTGPLLPTSAQLMQTADATAEAERRWALTLEEVAEQPEALTRLIERNPDACLKYGVEYACPYHGLCWRDEWPDDTQFVSREDHHA